MTRGFIKPEDQEPNIVGFEFYYDAFQELSTARPIGLAVGPIPFTAIAEYFKIYELQDFEEFAYLIRRMDNTFLELNDSNTKKVEGKKSGATNPNKKNTNKG